MTRSAVLRCIGLCAALLLACGGPTGGPPGGGGGGGGGAGGGGGSGGTAGVNDAQVKVLANNLTYPYNLVVDTRNLYWIDAQTGEVGSVPIDGSGAATSVVSAGSAAGWDLAQDSSNIYFTLNDFTLRKVAKTGGTPVSLISAGTNYPGCSGGLCEIIPTGLVVVGGNVLFGDSDPGNGAASGPQPNQVLSISTGGTGLTNLATANAPNATANVLVAENGTTVFFASDGDITGNALKSVPISGGSATTIMAIDGDLHSIAAPATGAGAGSVFIAGREAGQSDKTLRKVTNGAQTTLATVIFNASRAIAVDDQNIYYPKLDTDSGGSVIAKMSLTTNAETILAGVNATDGVAGGLAVDGTRVYWTAGGDISGKPSIRSVPK